MNRTAIDPGRAAEQHARYEDTLASLGCQVRRVTPAPQLPDSVFIEDTAVVLPELAVVARPGAASRRAETESVAVELCHYRGMHRIEPPGTLDGGDVLRIGREVYIGASTRTNAAGAKQLRALLEPWGYRVRRVPVRGCLHLKSAVGAIGGSRIVVQPDWVDETVFVGLDRIRVDPAEPGAANVLPVGEAVVMAAGHPATRRRLEARGVNTVAVDISELAQAEAGVTCCSLLVGPTDPRHQAPSVRGHELSSWIPEAVQAQEA